MNREQLERLGEGGLRQMARRVGLRGARHLDRSLLITGLTAYFARLPADDEDDGGPTDEPPDAPVGAVGIPPALSTETMARLLESQGEASHASAVRARLAADADARSNADTDAIANPDGAPTAAAVPAVQVTQVGPDGVELTWLGADQTQAGLVLRLWTGAGDPVQWELPVTTASGHMRFDPPPHTIRVCAALGRLSPEGFVPAARSPVLLLAPTTPGDEGP